MDLFAQMVEELRISKYPTILYGAGYTARETRKFLEKNSIFIAGYAVDDQYLTNNRHYEGIYIFTE